jgi:hypothetical protein
MLPDQPLRNVVDGRHADGSTDDGIKDYRRFLVGFLMF